MHKSGWRSMILLTLAIAFYAIWMGFAFGPQIISFVPHLEYDSTLYAADADRTQARDEVEAVAQVWVANAAWWQVWLSAVGLLGLVATVFFARNAWLEAQQANKDARAFFAEERRPWLAVTARSNGWHVVEGNPGLARISVTVFARNVGQSPATNCLFDVPARAISFFSPDELSAFRRHIAQLRTEPPAMFLGETIFPNTDPAQRSALVEVELLPLGKGRHLLGGRVHIPILVSYFFAGSGARHVTPIVLDVLLSWHEATNDFRHTSELFPANIPPD